MVKIREKGPMSLDEFLTEVYGPIGTKERDDFEAGVAKIIKGDKLKNTRENEQQLSNKINLDEGAT